MTKNILLALSIFAAACQPSQDAFNQTADASREYGSATAPPARMTVTATRGPPSAVIPASTSTVMPARPAEICGDEGTPAPAIVDLPFQAFDAQLLTCVNKLAPSGQLERFLESSTWTIDGSPVRFVPRQILTDLTADGNPDIVLELFYYFAHDDMYGQTYYVLVAEGDHYEIQSSGFFGNYAFWIRDWQDFEGQVRSVSDLNGNGLPELFLVSYRAERDSSTRGFRIIEWDGHEFIDLIDPVAPAELRQLVCVDSSDSVCLQFGDGSIVDLDRDGALELVLTRNEAPNYCYDGVAETPLPSEFLWYVFQWNGDSYAFSHSQKAPRYRIQAVIDGDLRAWCDIARALEFYQAAIFDESLLPWSAGPFGSQADSQERARLSAYSRYRILLLHVREGDLSAAQTVYSTLQDLFPTGSPGSQYAELARNFWEEYRITQDMSGACQKAIAYATLHSHEVLDPLGRLFYRPYYSYDPYPELICPLI